MFAPNPPDIPRVFALPPGADFARHLAEGIVARTAGMPPEALARIEVYVNTRRMQRRVAALLSQSGARLLPRLRLITDLGRDIHVPGTPPPVPALRRRLELAQLVARLLDTAPDLAPRAAIHDLADSLARLMAEMQGEGVPPETLAQLDIADHARHWERSLSFIRLVADWFGPTAPPDAESRQRQVVDHLIARWQAAPPAHPIVIAGSTGSRGTTARLMEATARLPQGALVLPGFDFDMPTQAWASLQDARSAEDHPQYRFRRLMDALDIAPRDVMPWAKGTAPAPERNKLISLALRPAPVTDQWRSEGAGLGDLVQATCDLTLIEAPSPRAEALAIALILREAAETGQRAALITPDRTLSRQVTAALDRWAIRPDDSAGRPLALSASGRFLRHVAALFGQRLTPQTLITLLKHPLTHSGPGRNRHLLLSRALERSLRRHGPPFPDAASLRAWAVGERTEGAADWANWLSEHLTGLEGDDNLALQDHVGRHLALAEALAAGPQGAPAGALWQEAPGQEAFRLVQELRAEAAHGGQMSPRDYAALFTGLAQAREVREPALAHSGIMIWGTLEARVQGADLVILAGLNEGVWPENPAPDPWLNRTMRAQAGLLLPERQIGLAAHDFQQAACAPRVVLSRAQRNAEAETVPARWVNRLTNLMGGLADQGGPKAIAAMRGRGAEWLALAAAMEADFTPLAPAPRPAPRPPLAARPRELPVTAITRLIRDPYHVYARYVLRLFPLDPLHKSPDMLLRGSVLHKVVETFTHADENDRARLMALTDSTLAELVPWATARILWRARMDRVADSYLAWEALHPGVPALIEKKGSVMLDRHGFLLTAKPDRIDILPDDRLHILDYKTGKPPNEKQQRHFDKQLLLEAAMAEHGAFESLGAREVAAITYISLAPPDPKNVETRLTPGLTAEIWTELEALISAYMKREQGYAARRAVAREGWGGDYDHLSRFGEWQTSDTPLAFDVGGAGMTPRDDATERQVQAADPAASTWLSANAGSGKTRVLTDRVARLLLRGVPPQRVLCLTYTKAAASEMQNRLFQRLGAWAMLDDGALIDALAQLGVEGQNDADTLRRARRLFASAIETPGGLKIQTIHAFCAGLLRRFPLEAGVSPGFTEIDERTMTILRDDVIEDLAERHPEALRALAQFPLSDGFDRLAAEMVRHRGALTQSHDAAEMFGLKPDFNDAALLAEVFLGSEAKLFASLMSALEAGSANDVKAAIKLRKLSRNGWLVKDIELLEGVLLYVSGEKKFTAKLSGFPTKATKAALGDSQHALEALMLRVEAARPRRLTLAAVAKTQALHDFARVFLPEYEARKARMGWLDFDDLILGARRLLSDPSVAQWVLYKLDGGVDHILVDEAQDTSPEQWRVIELLTQEFTAGIGAEAGERTIFVVGDKKQSIYSFQGADLAAFDRMRTHFAARLKDMGIPLVEMPLEHSFRSSNAILRLVDDTFDAGRGHGLGGAVNHIAFRSAMPGRVDLWPVIEKSETPEDREWFDPVDIITDEHHDARLARRIATEIARMLAEGVAIPHGDDARQVRAGDFLILVQRRSALFYHLIRACKAANLPIAGADRMNLAAELAVKDLTSLMAFVNLPEDDLALAEALRSPLLGWSEDALFRLAHGRPGTLWQALRSLGGDAYTIVSDLLDSADFLRPFEVLERILTRHDGRRRLLARLGAEAEDGIDALLSQALAYEQTDVPSLTGFLTWLQTGDVTIKRQLDSAGDRIRVMTVHGAKGLEAPIVILPDTAQRKPPMGKALCPLPGGIAWAMGADENPPAIAEARAAEAAAQEEERARLLYVAMTRAECWLIVAAAGSVGDGACWYDQVRMAMDHAGAVPHAFHFGPGARLSHAEWPTSAPPETDRPLAISALPAWLKTPPPVVPRDAAALTPTGLGGAKALLGEGADLSEDDALRRGRQMHRLLEHLPNWPRDNWPVIGADLLASGDDTEPQIALRAGLVAEAQAVLDAPELAPLFAPGTLTEVEITADLLGRRLVGTIDRLVIDDNRILAVDYKSNAIVPGAPDQVPEGLLRQMAAYRAALAQVFPDHRVETALLWTAVPVLMPLPEALLDAALARASAALVEGREMPEPP